MIKVVCSPLGNSQFAWHAMAAGQAVQGRSATPLFDACRKIKSMGGDPLAQIALFHEGASQPALMTTVGKGAALTVHEGEGRVRFTKWKGPNPSTPV